MKIPPIEPFVHVSVEWEDAGMSGSLQCESIDLALQSYKPIKRKSTGLFIGVALKQGRRALLLGTDDDRTEDSPEAIGGIQQIPIAMVLDITTYVEEKKPPRKRR